MKTIFLVIAFSALIPNTIAAQYQGDPGYSRKELRDTAYNVCNVIGFIPSKVEKVNGWALGWLMLGAYEHHHDSVSLNGLYTNPSPLALLMAGFALPYLFATPFMKETYSTYPTFYDESIMENKINGLAISFMEVSERYTVNGAQITLISNTMFKLNGFSINFGFSEYQYIHGVVISGILNQTEKGKGMQIGLINVAQDFRGVQIGLWNKNGKRSFPIINLKFKKNDQK